MMPSKDCNNLPVTDPKDMNICYLPDKEFKIPVLRNLTELQESTERQFNNNSNTIHKMRRLTRVEIIKEESHSGAEKYNE